MTEQRRRGKYPDEMRERAVRMVFEAQRDCGSQWEAISSVAERLGRRPEPMRRHEPEAALTGTRADTTWTASRG
ncbi:MAG: hypothetical protein OXC00_07100 [Acidimicrobiaceae bacterium]|nr:hypothetical protein [Acidimicrobiaceae bacterium]